MTLRQRIFPAVALASIMMATAIRPIQAQNDIGAPLLRAGETYRSANTIRVQFTQRLTNPLTGTTSVSRGELLRKHPNLFSINFTEPADGDRMVSDGKAVWIYLPSSTPNQVLKTKLDHTQHALIDPVSQILTASLDLFTVTSAGESTIQNKPVRGITLVPKTKDPRFTKVTAWIDASDAVRRLDVEEPSGIRRQITIESMARNVSLPKSAFVFTPPPKARIIDQRSLGG